MVPIVFLLNGFVKGDFKEAFLFAIAVAVGLTPEMLPMVVTANLAKGAVTMAKQKVIVKRLNTIQNLGAMDVLCTDKTGTLTQDRVILKKHRDIRGEVDLRVLEYAYLNSYYQTGLKNLLDRAVLEHAELRHKLDVLQHADKVDEISVDTATDIARESADIILLEKSLLVFETGVLKGREVYGNIIKYVKMTASSNFGNVFSVLVASAFIPFLPMLPVQLFVLNLLYDLSQLSLPWDRMDSLRRPRKWDTTGIARFMVWIGPISSVFDITTFLLLWFVFHAKGLAGEATFQSGWFIESLLSQGTSGDSTHGCKGV
jgi:magnesium-transporting ATPase (P-type)